MASIMKDLFDDDSSDEDEMMDEEASSPAVRRIIQEYDEDDSSDAADEPSNTAPPKETPPDEKETNKERADKATSKETPVEGEAPTNTSQEQDEDDDVEFDDDGVVGSSAPVRKRVTSGGTEATQTVKRPAKKPRHMQVLESDRPPAGTSLHITKLPNVVGIQTEPFDPDTYSASLEEQDYRGYVHSMIRWRYARTDSGEFKRDADGKLIRESNARLVAWDDGNGGPKSYTLHVGDEVFEVDTTDSSSNGFAGLNGYLYLSQKATLPDEDHTPAGTVLECMGAFQNRLVARPSLQSKAHKDLTVAVRQKTIKKARIAEHVTQEDPEKAKQDRIKVKEDLEKASARKKQTSYRRPAMSRRYLEEDDGDYDTINIRDMKRRGRDFDADMDYGEDSEEDEEEEDESMFNRRRPTKRASRQKEVQADDEEDELVFEEESDEEEIKATAGKKLQHQALVDDDDED